MEGEKSVVFKTEVEAFIFVVLEVFKCTDMEIQIFAHLYKNLYKKI